MGHPSDVTIMDREDALDKIRKCLALSESPNENEARAALTMARKLMATYKIGEDDLDSDDLDRTPTNRISSVTYTTLRDNWMPSLIRLISERFCCRGYTHREHGKKLRHPGFIGFPHDVDVCIRAFEYTVNTIRSNTHGKAWDNALRDSYARGFIAGLDRAYRDQDSELEATLCDERSLTVIMSVPPEVDEFSNSMLSVRKVKIRSYKSDFFSYNSGYMDGKNHLNRKVGKGAERITSENARQRPKV